MTNPFTRGPQQAQAALKTAGNQQALSAFNIAMQRFHMLNQQAAAPTHTLAGFTKHKSAPVINFPKLSNLTPVPAIRSLKKP